MRVKSISSQDVEKEWNKVNFSPLLPLGKHKIKRLGMLPPRARIFPPSSPPQTLFGAVLPFVVLYNGDYYRLPDWMDGWAVDIVALAQAVGNPCPCWLIHGKDDVRLEPL